MATYLDAVVEAAMKYDRALIERGRAGDALARATRAYEEATAHMEETMVELAAAIVEAGPAAQSAPKPIDVAQSMDSHGFTCAEGFEHSGFSAASICPGHDSRK